MNLYNLIARRAAEQPGKTAVASGAEELSYGQLDLLARRLARRMASQGIGRGDIIGLRMMDSPPHLAAMLGAMRRGATVLPLDWRSTTLEIARIVERFRPKAVMSNHPAALPSSIVTIGLDGIEQGELEEEAPVNLQDSALALGLTSGTTGEAKGIVVTHEQMYGRHAALSAEGVMLPTDRFLAALPLAYAAGREYFLSLLCCGATADMLSTLCEPAAIVDRVRESAASVLMLSPNMIRGLLDLPATSQAPLMPQLRLFISGMARLHEEERAAIRTRLAPHLVDCYGSSGGGPITILDAEAEALAPHAIGRPVAGMSIEVVDEAHAPMAAGQTGRIRLRGPGVTTCFVGAAEASDEALHDGWYYTGDLGDLDDKGFLYLRGRAADLIKRGGVMVHAQEVEQILGLHPAVVESAVISVPCPVLGEDIAGFVVLRESVQSEALIAHCRRHLAAYKIPRSIDIVTSLPRNASGKVKKGELRRH